MTQPADAPPAADPSQPPPAAEAPHVRAAPDRRSSLERAHDAVCGALGMLENEDGHQPDARQP